MSTIAGMTPTQAEALEEPQERQFPFPGVPTTADGAAAVVWAETHN